MSIQRRLELERYCYDQVAKWRRLSNLVKKVPNLLEVEGLILEGNEEGIKSVVMLNKQSLDSLIEKAKKLHIKYYGRMTRKELINAIRNYEKNQICRQRYER